MMYQYTDEMIDTRLILSVNEPTFKYSLFKTTDPRPALTIVWNRGDTQDIVIDGIVYQFPHQSIMTLVANQTFELDAKDMVIWQFNKPFYCIEDNDHEVSCIGFLFWGNRDFFTIDIQTEVKEFEMLLHFFISEFHSLDTIQGEMLRALLKRLIIRINKLARQQQLNPQFKDIDMDIVRQFNVLLEKNFKNYHQVQDYAHLLHKSPKTLTNVFAMYNDKSPLEVIHGRIILEAKRLLLYSDMSVKQVAWHLGFEEVSHFSRLFKKVMNISPAEFKLTPQKALAGDIDN